MTDSNKDLREILKTFETKVVVAKPTDSYMDLVDEAEQALLTWREQSVLKLLPKFDTAKFSLLGCLRHWSDDSSLECTCDENMKNVELGYDSAISDIKAALKEKK